MNRTTLKIKPNYHMQWAPFLLLAACLWLHACGPAKEESWSSYYYGTGRVSGVYYDDQRYPADNDAVYELPPSYWEDNQIPQGQKW